MKPETIQGLVLTADEAFALLGLCLTSPTKLDGETEQAIQKLAEYCKSRLTPENSNHQSPDTTHPREFLRAGA